MTNGLIIGRIDTKGAMTRLLERYSMTYSKKPYIYTIESSFFGYQKEGDFRITPYQPNDYREMGVTVFRTFVELTKKKMHSIRDLRTLICDK